MKATRSRMRMKSLITVAFILWTAAFVVGADNRADYLSAAMKTHKGYRVVLNEKGRSFTLEIVGPEVRVTSKEQMFFAVDKRFLQVNCVSIEQLAQEKGIPADDSKKILEAHRDWETEYVS